MTQTVYVAQVNVLQDGTQSTTEVFTTYGKAVAYIIETMIDARGAWDDDDAEAHITQFIKENYWFDMTDYEVSISKKNLL